MRKDLPCNSILELKQKSVGIGIHELVIQNDRPYRLNELALEVGEHFLGCCLAKYLEVLILDRVIKLGVM
jgi:hypothetical protein